MWYIPEESIGGFMGWDEVREFAARYAPPATLATGLSLMIYRMPNNTVSDWPILGEFVMDDGLKAIFIALGWFFSCAAWTLIKAVTPRLRYSREVVDATKQAREKLHALHGVFLQIETANSGAQKIEIFVNENIENSKIGANLQSESVSELFFETCIAAMNQDKEGFYNSLKIFRKKTSWIRWR